jgi:predicted Rossmann fold nucleotide-binding protein DprA/Smf involved in DNA uptake
LIRDGAVLTARLEDILDALGPVPQHATEPMLFEPNIEPAPAMRTLPLPSFENVSDRQKKLLESLGPDRMNVDSLVEATELPAHVVLQEMTFLTLKGHVRRIDGQSWSRRS